MSSQLIQIFLPFNVVLSITSVKPLAGDENSVETAHTVMTASSQNAVEW